MTGGRPSFATPRGARRAGTRSGRGAWWARRAPRHRLSGMRDYAAAGGRRRCTTGRRWETADALSGRSTDEVETLTVTGGDPGMSRMLLVLS